MKKNIGKFFKILIGVFTSLCIFCAVLLFNASHWVTETWGLLSIDEIIYHLKAPLDGTNSDVILDFMKRCIPDAVILLFAAAVVLILLRSKRSRYTIGITVELCAAVGITFLGAKHIWNELDIGTYVEAQNTVSTLFEEEYADPKEMTFQFPEQKRNLIYIFLESMEATYMSKDAGGAYDINYIPELTQLANENISFSNGDQSSGIYPAIGSVWTMGAMFAHTSGLPLKVPGNGNAMNEQSEFFPDIYTIGDILKDAGYNQELLIGSEGVFGGRSLYFSQHGDYEILDHPKIIELGRMEEGYHVFWGYEDEKLFGYAKEELTALSQEDAPFNLTLLTVDTHFEDGYVCRLCGDEYENQYENVIACSSRQIWDFVQWIKEQPFYENTSIVLVGDHLTMDSDFCEDIDENYERGVYNAFINSAVSTENTKNRIATTMDLFPTTLASMGVTFEGNRLGIGTNLFSEEATLAEEMGLEYLNQEINKKSMFFEELTKNLVRFQVVADKKDNKSIQLCLQVPKPPAGLKDIEFIIYPTEESEETADHYPAEKNVDGQWTAEISADDLKKNQTYRIKAYATYENGVTEFFKQMEYTKK